MGVALLLAQLTIATVAPDTVRWREPIPVRVVVQVPGREAPRLVAPALGGLAIAGSYDETRLESRNGRYWVTLERRYDLRARRPGTYEIGEFEARLGADRVRSRPQRVHVVATGDTLPPAVVTRARIDSRAHVNFRALVLPDTVYVGQQATYQVGVFLDDEVRLRLRRNPEFIPPEPRAMLSYELRPRALDLPPRIENGVRYEVHAFERALFPLSAGRYVIPPAQLVYALPLSSSFFSRSESFTMRSESLAVVAVEPPEAGRPEDYAGAVGRIEVRARVDSAAARVGDPLLLTVQVAGVGNVKLFPRPEIQVPWGSTVAAGERVRIDSSSSLVRGAKEFDWIVTPTREGTVALAPVRYPYFNPYTERYEIAVTAGDTLDVAPGALARVDSAGAAEPPPLALVEPDGAEPTSPLARREFWAAVLLAPLMALAALLIGRRRAPRAVRRPHPADRLRSLARTRGVSAGDVRRAFVGALARRAALGLEALTRDGELAHALRRAGVTAATASRAEALLRELDAAAFAGGAPPRDAGERALGVYRAVDAEARRLPGGAGSAVLALVCCLTSATAHAQAPPPDAHDPMRAGIAAYEARAWVEARDLFAAAARAEPRSHAAWSNLGTAAWAAGDTVGAVTGWQRALRLDPLDGDARERLSGVPGAVGGQVSDVPAVPPLGMPALALVLWVAGWSLVAWRALRGPRWSLPAGGGVAALGALALLLAYEAERRRATANLAVVSERAAVHALAALVSDSVGVAGTGALARITEERGAWARVRMDDGREGWVERARLVPLGR